VELKSLPPDFNELRNIIISSNLTSCYLILEEMAAAKGDRIFFDKFRAHWIDIYKNIYDHVSKMKPREKPRE
jgi:hypothetical protein